MRWTFGKHDWATIARGQENCFLLTNGLGGFSSQTMLGSVTRGDHAFFMACLHAPNLRYNLVNRISEKLMVGGQEFFLSSQEFTDEQGVPWEGEDGYRNLSGFVYDTIPSWLFQVKGVEIEKKAAMRQGKNTVAVLYHVDNRNSEPVRLVLTPYFRFAPKGKDMEAEQKIVKKGNAVTSAGITLYFRTNGEVLDIEELRETCYYSYDICDGRAESGQDRANHQILFEVGAQKEETLELIYEMEMSQEGAEEILEGQKQYADRLTEAAGLVHPLAQELVKAADQFIAKRESTQGETILAGFPFFEDWGRDTMISLPGVCISTKQYEKAKSILRTFAYYEKDGLLPNLFPEGGNLPMYNSADAPLLFILTVYQLYTRTQEKAFLAEMLPVMKRIVEAYQNGTAYGIHMEADGLIAAGEGLDQVTWMDVRIGEILPTPRHGKPVEINAYWYNVLCIMREVSGEEYGILAERVRRSFQEKFWMEDKGYLRDVLSGTPADEQLRCNQIWAVSLPFSVLDREKEKRVVDTVFRELYTPYGLRTLQKADPAFRPHYGGPVLERDLAYHQGTVWAFPLGAYYLAFLKVHDYDDSSAENVKRSLELLEDAMREGCIGQLPEIYDGENPVFSRGCFAQAWSSGELLRVFETLEMCRRKRNDL